MTLGDVFLLCLDARVSFEIVYNSIRNFQVAAYKLLPILPALRNKLPKQQLYELLQMLERVDFVSECVAL